MTHPVRDTAGAEINRLWRAQQAKQQAAQQNANSDAHHDVTAKEKPPVIHSDTPKPTGETPAECVKCTVAKECKTVLKLWYQKKPRPQLVQAWVRLVDEHAAEMPCLSKMQTQDSRFSLREGK